MFGATFMTVSHGKGLPTTRAKLHMWSLLDRVDHKLHYILDLVENQYLTKNKTYHSIGMM